MSTLRGLYRPPVRTPAAMKAMRTTTVPFYRCVYCKRILKDKFSLPAHEAQCDARVIMRRIWAMTVERALKAEERAGGKSHLELPS